MEQIITSILVPVGDMVLSLVTTVPVWAIRFLFIGLLALVCIWVFRLSPQVPESGKAGPLTDLRYFAGLVLALQALCYIVF